MSINVDSIEVSTYIDVMDAGSRIDGAAGEAPDDGDTTEVGEGAGSEDTAALVRGAAAAEPAIGLVAVRALRRLTERLESLQVDAARRQGWSWQAIADLLQVSRQAVHQKHGRRTHR